MPSFSWILHHHNHGGIGYFLLETRNEKIFNFFSLFCALANKGSRGDCKFMGRDYSTFSQDTKSAEWANEVLRFRVLDMCSVSQLYFFPLLLACRHFLSPFNNFFFSISRFFSQLMVHCYSFFSLTFISNLPLIIFYIACDSRKRNNHVM